MAKKKQKPEPYQAMQLCYACNARGDVILGTIGASFVAFDSKRAAAKYLRQVADNIENYVFGQGKTAQAK